tara:strand:- start:73307 stop:74674 length:1368 start_codon:yes stop_codon:yes gene_type:complete
MNPVRRSRDLPQPVHHTLIPQVAMRCRRNHRWSVAAAIALSIVMGTSAAMHRTLAQAPPVAGGDSRPAAPEPASDNEAAGVEPPDDQREQPSDVSDDQIRQWIEMLGSPKFAVRERAAIRLVNAGEKVVPELKQLAATSSDPEIRLRASELAKQIGQGNEEAKIEAFLSGKSENLDGWEIAKRVLGDTGSIRELYAEVVLEHPEIAGSLSGTARDRAIAMNAAAARVRKAMVEEGRFPNRADAVALLFPLIFDRGAISNEYELLLIRTLRGEAGSLLYQSATLSVPYQRLVGGWSRRTGIANRQDVLWLMMSHNVIHALPLALETLSASTDPETLTIALQAIARFGNQRNADSISKLLHDDRAVAVNGFIRGKASRTELGDAATATLAILYNIPLADVGFEAATIDPKFGFRPEEVGFAMGDKSRRTQARQRVLDRVKEINNADSKQDPVQLLVE